MHPLNLTIHGEFWDCQIYRGRLYLFGRAGDLRVVDWEKLIDRLSIESDLKLASACAFTNGDYLYGDRWALLFSDLEFKELILSKFSKLGRLTLELDQSDLESATIAIHDSPFPFPHIDSTIYDNKMYVGAQAGVFGGSIGRGLKYGISSRPKKLWDCPVIGISGAYNALALAAGGEGLFKRALHTYQLAEPDAQSLSTNHCANCSWVYHDVFGSSRISDGCLASFEKRAVDDSKIVGLQIQRLVSANIIFNHHGYAWGAHDKLYQYREEERLLFVKRYSPYDRDPERRIQDLGTLGFLEAKGAFVGAKVAMFGTVLEFESAVVVLPSDGGPPHNCWGEPITWRVFPRSKRYENHLHIVYENHIRVSSFNHDYFVNQATKLLGIRRYSDDRRYGTRTPEKGTPAE